MKPEPSSPWSYVARRQGLAATNGYVAWRGGDRKVRHSSRLAERCARSSRPGRAPRRAQLRTGQSGAGRLRNMVLISDRPPEVEDRAVPGHFEGDLIVGKRGLGSRQRNGGSRRVRHGHQEQVESRNRHSPWQRGNNEDTNGLLRPYCPEDADLRLHSAAHFNAVARRLNDRPRQTLGWMKPSEVFSRTVASID